MKTIIAIIFCLFAFYNSHSQNIIKIKNRNTEKETEIKIGDGVQFYYKISPNNNLFIFGTVRHISESSILLSSRAELNLNNVTHIDRVPLVKRSLPLAALTGISIGVIGIITNAPLILQILAIAPATYISVMHTMKFNRKQLKRNKVGETVDVYILKDSTDKSSYSIYPYPFNLRYP